MQKNLFRNVMTFFLFGTFFLGTNTLAQSSNFEKKQKWNIEDQKFFYEQSRGWTQDANYGLRMEILDKDSRAPIENICVDILDKNGMDFKIDYSYYNEKITIKPYSWKTNSQGIVSFCLREEDAKNGKLNNAKIKIYGDKNYYYKQFDFKFKEFENFLNNKTLFDSIYEKQLVKENTIFLKFPNTSFYRQVIYFDEIPNHLDFFRQVDNGISENKLKQTSGRPQFLKVIPIRVYLEEKPSKIKIER